MWMLIVKLMSPAPWWLDPKLRPAPVLPAPSGNVAPRQSRASGHCGRPYPLAVDPLGARGTAAERGARA